MKKVLLCSLSPRSSQASYVMEEPGKEEKSVKANQSPLALLQMMPEGSLPEKILVLCTDEVGNNAFPAFRRDLTEIWQSKWKDRQQPDVSKIDIPDGQNKGELWEILNRILENIEADCELTLDITHGFRSLPFLYFVAALYLQSLRGVKIKAVYYAMFEVKGDIKPVVDLSVLLDMIEWFYSTRFFRESGQAHHLARLLEQFETPPPGTDITACKSYGNVKTLRKKLQEFSEFYRLGLPFEQGREADLLANLLSADSPEILRNHVPLLDELLAIMMDFLEPIRLPGQQGKKRLNKNDIELTEEELRRQANLVDSYLKQGYLNMALGLIRELIISCIIYHNCEARPPKGKEWIHIAPAREKVEDWLGEQVQLMQEKGAEKVCKEDLPGYRDTILLWQEFSNTRNKLLHCGYDLDNVKLKPEKINDLHEKWEKLKSSLFDAGKWYLGKCEGLELTDGDGKAEAGGRQTAGEGCCEKVLLISPLGMSSGLLFSAISHLRERLWKVWVISSDKAVEALDEIKEKSGFGGEIEVMQAENPFTCFEQGNDFYDRVHADALQAGQVVVNLTGGTTALQFVVQETADLLKKEGVPVERIALIDRRSVEEQKKDPYVVGDIVNLDKSKERAGKKSG